MRRKSYLNFFLNLLVLGIYLLFFPAKVALIPETGHGAFNPPRFYFATASVLTAPVAEIKVGNVSFPVVQQPSGQPGYVSTVANTVTQFSAASNFGSLGFLAHNYLAGGKFFDVKVGDKITLTYQDKERRTFAVTEVRSFQAITSRSPYSDFIDLKSGSKLTYKELFSQTYGVPGRLILQTCIAANGDDSWGRLFIIAIPVTQDKE